MGKCPSCGHKEWLLTKYNCDVCGKEVCRKCEILLFRLAEAGENPKAFLTLGMTVRICSERCWNDFLEETKRFIDENLDVPPYTTVDGEYVTEVLKCTFIPYLRTNVKKWLKSATYWAAKLEDNELDLHWNFDDNIRAVSTPSLTQKDKYYSYMLYHELYKQLSLKEARNRENHLFNEAKHCEKVGRYEDAARAYEEIAILYEQMKLYDKARQIREKARQILGKEKKVVVVDLNKLIQQVKDGGIVMVYRCPHCSGKLKIGKDTSVESLKVCEYCGSTIKAMDLADFLRTALS